MLDIVLEHINVLFAKFLGYVYIIIIRNSKWEGHVKVSNFALFGLAHMIHNIHYFNKAWAWLPLVIGLIIIQYKANILQLIIWVVDCIRYINNYLLYFVYKSESHSIKVN